MNSDLTRVDDQRSSEAKLPLPQHTQLGHASTGTQLESPSLQPLLFNLTGKVRVDLCPKDIGGTGKHFMLMKPLSWIVTNSKYCWCYGLFV